MHVVNGILYILPEMKKNRIHVNAVIMVTQTVWQSPDCSHIYLTMKKCKNHTVP